MTIPKRPTYIRDKNLSIAWVKAFDALLSPGVDSLVPLIVNLSQFSGGFPAESQSIRSALNRCLTQDKRLCRVEATANVIFPENLWNRYRNEGREFFFRRYLEVTLPRLKKGDRRNRNGTYFERMLCYGPDEVRQLSRILRSWNSGSRRRSALQVMLFDPSRDHSNSPYMAFPCLDHVAFAPDGDGGLSVTAFYANQYIYDRGYGNYLGLCALGRFVAGELDLEFRQLTCIAGIAQLPTGSITKRAGRKLIQKFSEVPDDSTRTSVSQESA